MRSCETSADHWGFEARTKAYAGLVTVVNVSESHLDALRDGRGVNLRPSDPGANTCEATQNGIPWCPARKFHLRMENLLFFVCFSVIFPVDIGDLRAPRLGISGGF